MSSEEVLGKQKINLNNVLSDEEIQKVLNIPTRDTENYPEASKEKQLKGGTFLYKLNLLASGADGNLQSLVWDLYDKLDDFLNLNKENSSIELAKTLEELKDYIQTNKNIIFSEIKEDK